MKMYTNKRHVQLTKRVPKKKP